MIGPFLNGALMMAFAVIGVIYLRFWKDTRDTFFALFGVAFGMLSLERIPLAIYHQMKEAGSLVYLIRLLAFLLIIVAILQKNRQRHKVV